MLKSTHLIQNLQNLNLEIWLDNDLAVIEKVTHDIGDLLKLRNLLKDKDLIYLQLALIELLTNAVEHGNLEIGGQTKSDLRLNDDALFSKMFEERTRTEPYKSRQVKLTFEMNPLHLKFVIEDQGPGFAHQDLNQEIHLDTLELPSGRGVYLSRRYVDELYYNDKGNQVTFIKHLNTEATPS